MKDRIPTYAGRIKLIPVDESNGIYDIIRADEPIQEGTPINKNSLLKDETANIVGLGEEATPDDCFNFLFTEVLSPLKHICTLTRDTNAAAFVIPDMTLESNTIYMLIITHNVAQPLQYFKIGYLTYRDLSEQSLTNVYDYGLMTQGYVRHGYSKRNWLEEYEYRYLSGDKRIESAAVLNIYEIGKIDGIPVPTMIANEISDSDQEGVQE